MSSTNEQYCQDSCRDSLTHVISAQAATSHLARGGVSNPAHSRAVAAGASMGHALAVVHDSDTEALAALARAYAIHDSLSRRAETKAASDELEFLARAVHVQDVLIAKELARRRRGLSALRTSSASRAKAVHASINKLSCAEMSALDAAREEHTRACSEEELQRLEAAYHVHVELQQREDARLEASELRNLIAAAIIEERLIAREERALAAAEAASRAAQTQAAQSHAK
jgi:hypothetical protein